MSVSKEKDEAKLNNYMKDGNATNKTKDNDLSHQNTDRKFKNNAVEIEMNESLTKNKPKIKSLEETQLIKDSTQNGNIGIKSTNTVQLHSDEIKKSKKGSACNSKKKESAFPYEFHINNHEANKVYEYRNNMINQAKYNIFTFLPMSLLFQFFRLANVYFLIIAILQLISIVSPLSPTTAVVPLVVVLLFSMTREGVEDLARHKYDDKLNSEPTMLFKDNMFVKVESGMLEMGQIVLVQKDEDFPADIVVLDSNIINGVCFIETATLDGEKALKNKIASKLTAGLFRKEDGNYRTDINISGVCACDKPNPDLYKFDGKISLTHNGDKVEKRIETGLDAKQLLLKGAILKNTDWIIGFVAYTGHNNRLIKNSKKAKLKISRAERLMTFLLLIILGLQIAVCIIVAIFNKIFWETILKDAYYINDVYGGDVNAVISFFTYILLFNTMIPISLIVSLEIVKMIQGQFMGWDVEMYSEVRKKFAKPCSISLNEELGQVNFIFSDKTGTLTGNKMNFKYCVIGDVCFEYNRLKNDPTKDQEDNYQRRQILREEMDIIEVGPNYMVDYLVNEQEGTTYDNLVVESKSKTVKLDLPDDRAVIEEYWKALGLAHECVVEGSSFSGLSPDDIELVKSCKEQGFEFIKSEASNFRRLRIAGKELNYEVLVVNEFSSDRKRMSIILVEGDLIKMYIKGADSEIEQRLAKKGNNENFISQAQNYIKYFSNMGYRTLMVGMKIISTEEFETYFEGVRQAGFLSSSEKEAKLNKLNNEIERDIFLLGATIVEDKLQDKVPETIRDLRLAGVKVWMLTGDKLTTAKNIGLSCNLISHQMRNFEINGEKKDTLERLVTEYKEYKPKENEQFGILIDAVALTIVLADDEKTETFLQIAHLAASVICCRVSPLQKSEVVKVMKEFDNKAVTLAIGDGGNDVSMIMEAHIGVGVYGEEGMRAVQACDYAIGEFKCLRRLLMFHGRVNLIRVSEMILYFFYKNFIFTIVHFYYAFYTNCSGQTIIDDWFISLYNLIFTGLPLIIKASFDHDVIPCDGYIIDNLLPFLYKELNDKPIFHTVSFVLSLCRGLGQALIVFFFCFFSLEQAAVDSDGNIADLWYFSVNLFTSIIFIASFRVLITQKFWTLLNVLIMLITSWIAYLIFVIMVQYMDMFNSYASMANSFLSARFWLNFFVILGICSAIDFSTYCFDYLLTDTLSTTLQKIVKERGGLNNKADLPDSVMDYIHKFEQITQGKKKEVGDGLKYDVYQGDKGGTEIKLDRIDGTVL